MRQPVPGAGVDDRRVLVVEVEDEVQGVELGVLGLLDALVGGGRAAWPAGVSAPRSSATRSVDSVFMFSCAAWMTRSCTGRRSVP